MRRLYSTFPAGSPGVGLLFLRTAIGLTLVIQASAFCPGMQDVGIRIGTVCLLALASGVALVVGLLTPMACATAVLAGVGITCLSPSTAPWNFFSGNMLTIDVVVMVLVCALLGPGAFSLDAHFFGRRKIIIPRSSHSQAPLSSELHLLGSSRSHSPNSSPTQSSLSRPPRS